MLSIIIPIYNSESYITECIDSILCQTFRDFELILVNDCSTDNTANIINDYKKSDNRIKIINNKSNKGVGYCRKIGFENSIGDFILNVDSDDYLIGDILLETVMKEFDDNSVDIVDFSFRSVNRRRNYRNFKYCVIETNEDKEKMLRIDSFPTIWNKIIKRELYLVDNLFSEQRKEEPTFTYFKLIYYSKKIICLPFNKEIAYFYRNNKESITSQSDNTDVALFCTRTHLMLYEFFKEKNCKLYNNIFNEEHSKKNLELFEKLEEEVKKRYPMEYEELKRMVNIFIDKNKL